MKEVLIPPSAIRRMDIAALRAKAAELQAGSSGATPEARQRLYNTYIKVTDEIARRHAKAAQHPLLIERSAVYKMTAGELRAMWADLRYNSPVSVAPVPEVVNTMALLEAEQERRKALAKRTYARRKKEAPCSTP